MRTLSIWWCILLASSSVPLLSNEVVEYPFMFLHRESGSFTPSFEVQDSSNAAADSVSAVRTITPHDSAIVESSQRVFAVSRVHGVLSVDTSLRAMAITKRDIQTFYYTSLNDILDATTATYPLSLGYHGQPHARRTLGGGARDFAVEFNGRSLTDVATGLTNLNLYSPEDLENVEIYTGTAAIVMADNSSGALVNIQEPVHDVKGPFTRLWYADGANNYYASDGFLSQNIAPNTNLTLGFKRQAGDGRFDNQWLDAWNVRGRVRWTPNARTTLSLSEIFSNHGTGLNGGVDTSGSVNINDEVNASVRLPDYNERVYRHDLTASASLHLADSSLSLLQGSAYLSHTDWNLSRGTELFALGDSSRQVRRISSAYGLTVRWEHDISNDVRLLSGIDYELRQAERTLYNIRVDETRAAVFALATWHPSSWVTVRGGMRGLNRGDWYSNSSGLTIDARLHEQWNLILDLSQSERLPSAVEDASPEQTILGYARLRYASHDVRGELCGFVRQTRDLLLSRIDYSYDSIAPLLSTTINIPEQQVRGLYAKAAWTMFEAFYGDVLIQSAWTSRGSTTVSLLPSVYGVASVWYQKTIGRSELRAGITSRLRSAYKGEFYMPQSGLFIDALVDQDFSWGGIDVFGTARLGNAWIKLRFQNVLSNLFTTVSTFPFPVRNFSLSVAWSFFD